MQWTCGGEPCFGDSLLDRRPIGRGVVVAGGVVAGGEERRRKGLLLVGLAEEILMSWIWWSFWMCSRIFEVFAASKEHLGI